VQDSPPVMRNDEEAVENSEGERRHGEEIHCGDGSAMIAQKGRPSLCRLRIPWLFSHPMRFSPCSAVQKRKQIPGCSRICSGQSTPEQRRTTAFNIMAATHSIKSS
jgi:hypothetical protein